MRWSAGHPSLPAGLHRLRNFRDDRPTTEIRDCESRCSYPLAVRRSCDRRRCETGVFFAHGQCGLGVRHRLGVPPSSVLARARIPSASWARMSANCCRWVSSSPSGRFAPSVMDAAAPSR